MSDGWMIVTMIGGVALFVILLICGVTVLVEYTGLPGAIVEIEQVRFAVERIGSFESEDILGQAVAWNMKIASKQRYNKVWWAGWTIPNGWDKIELIELPAR